MIQVVLSDIHSRKNKLDTILHKIGVLKNGVRQDGFQLISVGDVVSAGYGMLEADFYNYWTNSILQEHDVELVGNHEAPMLFPYDDRFKFYGYLPGDLGQSGYDPELKKLVLARQNKYKIAHHVDDWIITHAGCHEDFFEANAKATADKLNDLWREHIHGYVPHPMHDCEICCSWSGCLWIRNLEKCGEPSSIKQIFGHTPDGPTLSPCGTMWNIDTPRLNREGLPRKDAESWGGVAALVRIDNEWKLYYVK